MAKKTIWQRIKGFFSGKKEQPARKSSAPKRVTREERIEQKNTGGSGGGGGTSYNRRELLNSIRGKSTEQENKPQYKSMADSTKSAGIAKAIDAKSSGLGETKKTPPKPKLTEKQELIEKARDKRKENFDKLDEGLANIRKKLDAERKSYNLATDNKYNPKVGTKEERERARQRIKSGEYQSDPKAAKWEYETHPVASMAARTAANSMAFGIPDVAAKRLDKYTSDEMREVDDIYRRTQEEHPWVRAGASLAGALVPYGGTAKAFEELGARAVGRAAETQLGRRLGAEALGRTMAGTGAKAALARSLVGDAIQDSTLGLLDTATDVAQRDDLNGVGDYARAIARGQLANYAMGLAGNAAANALPVAGRAVRNAWGNFADESRKLRFVPDGVGDVIGNATRPAREALQTESRDLDDEYWEIAREIENEYGSINPNFNTLTPEERVSVIERKNRMREITSRRKEIENELRTNVRREPPKARNVSSESADAVAEATPPKESAKQKTTTEILQGYSSTGSKQKLSDAKKRIQQLIADGDTRAAREEIARVVDDVTRNTKSVGEVDATIKEIKDELKNTRISISDKADAGYKSGSYNKFRQKNFGSFQLTEDGTPVDDLWQSLQERYGTSLFPEDISNPSDQLQYLADLAKSKGKEYELDDDEIAYLKDELSNSLWESANKGREHAPFNMRDEDWLTERAASSSMSDEELAELERQAMMMGDIESDARVGEAPKANAKPETAGTEPRVADEATSKFRKSRSKANAAITKRYKHIAEIYDADKTGKWVFYKDKMGRLCVGDPSAEHGRIRREGSYRWEDNGDYFGQLTKDNFEKAKKAFDDGNTNPYVPKSKKGAKESAKNLEPKAEPKAEEPKTDIVARGETKGAGETGEKTGAGERTEFKRSEEPSAKEQARNKRAEKKAKATQEGFDRDFAEFTKKISENREKVSKLNGRLRAAATEEEQQAIKDEIKALDDEIKQMHRRASLKYHPDMGGTNEWAQKFNDAFRDYSKRVYSSPNFSGASSKSSAGSTRNNTYKEYRQRYKNAGGSTPPPKAGAGGGGANTPPPKDGIGNYDGLRRPKGYAKRTQRAMNSVEDMVGASKEKKGWRETLRQFKDEANRKFVDSLKDFEDVARDLKSTKGKEAMQKLYGAIDKARRYRAVATTSVGSHQMKWDGTRYQIKGEDGVMRDAPSIAEIFSGMDKETEKSFNAYLLLKHNVDRLREGKPIFDNTVIYNEELSKRLGLPKDIDLMDADVCKKLAQDYEARFPEFKNRAAQVRQYTANELNNRVQAGLLPKEKMDEWLHDHPDYVPTYREGLFDGVGGIKGSALGASDLKAAKGSDLNIYDIKEQLADATVRNWRDISLNNLLEKTFGDNITKMAASMEVSPYTFALDHTMNVGKAADGGKYYANIFRDGKAERVEIDKRFYDDIKDLYKNGRIGNGLDGLNDKVLVPLADKWKKLITEWSPIFMVKNAMRDFPEAIINSRSRKEFLSITADGSALKDLLNHGEFSKALQDAGISASTFIDIDKAVKAFEKGEGGLKTLIPRLNAGVEMYPRLVEYMATIKKAGYDLKTVKISDIPMEIRDMAAANAADVTVNFGRSGSVGKLINKGAIPFFNPSIQGWSKFARNISELDGFKDTVGFLLSATALGAAPMVATNLLYQNNPNYQQISARDKANNYIIAIPPFDDKADTFIKIPRSRFASVYGLPLVNVANENKMGWADALHVANDQVAPLNPFESHLGANLIQAARNKTWYGTPIESQSMQNLPANERYDATTSGISIKTAKALNDATKGKVKISPKKLDYVLDANLGIVADVALPITTKAKQGQNPIRQVANVGKRAFTIDSATQNDLSTRYYDQASRLEQNKNSSEATEADKTAYKKFSSWDSRIKGVTNAMRYVQASDMPNKQEAYRELAKLRNEDMKKALNGKVSLNNTRDIDIIHKYAGNSYTIENLGKSADKNALKAYSAAVYGNLSEDEMKKKIDSDTEFYKGYKGIAKTQNALQRIDPKLKGGNGLTYAVGLADAGANDDVFAAYGTTLQSRTETATKAQRAKDYLKNNGSVEEFAQLENAVKTLGKLSDVDKGNLEDEAYAKLERGEMSIDEYNTELKKIAYNANQSHVGKAVSLAMSGAPARAYALYDIKEKNVQKGYNLAAMGIDSRKYREISQACDTDGNGYLKTAEIRDYVANSEYEDKATLFDALCYYNNVRNPFGTPNRYSVEEAAEVGKQNGVKQINANAGADNTTFAKDKSSSGSGWYSGYRRGYRRYGGYRHYGGGSSEAKVPSIDAKSMASAVKSAKATKVKLEPPTAKKVAAPKPKFKKYEV